MRELQEWDEGSMFGPTRQMGKSDGLFGPTRQMGELDGFGRCNSPIWRIGWLRSVQLTHLTSWTGLVGPTHPFGQLDGFGRSNSPIWRVGRLARSNLPIWRVGLVGRLARSNPPVLWVGRWCFVVRDLLSGASSNLP